MCELMKNEVKVDDIVWASAKRSIFWPAQVIEADVNGAFYTVHFFGEGTVETIKNQNKILHFCHPSHGKFISIGRKQHNIDKKLQFNKGLAAADKEMKSRKAKKQVAPLRRSPRKVTQLIPVGHGASGLGVKSRNNIIVTSEENGNCNKKVTIETQSLIKRTLFNEEIPTSSSEMAATRKSPRKKMKISEEHVERSPQRQKYTPIKRRNSGIGGANSTGAKTLNKYKAAKQSKCNKNCDQNIEQLESSSKRRKKKGKLCSNGNGDEVISERGPEGGDDQCSNVVIPSLKQSDDEGAQVSSGYCACLGVTKAVIKTLKKQKIKNNNCHKDKVVESRSSETNGNIGTSAVVGAKLDEPLCCQNQEEKDEEKAKSKDSTGADSPSKSDNSSDDDDLPEAFSLGQEPCSPGAFAVHDIVWAKYMTHPFWPAQILKIVSKKKPKKYYVKFLCDNCNHLIHVQEKNILPFSCNQRQTFVNQDVGTAQTRLYEAVAEAEDLVNRKGLGKNFEEDVENYNKLLENACDADTTDEGQEEKEASQSLETGAPVLVRRSSRERRQVSRYDDILTYIREALPTLKSIYEGKSPSARHQTYMHGRDRERDKLKLKAGFGPIGNTDLQEKIMGLLLSFLQEITKENQFSAVTYVSDVWLPEAIIFAIQHKDLVDRERAEEMYLTGSRVAVSQADVEQFTHNLKGKTLTDEDRDACWKRAERALTRALP